jgi:hypothetical protein
LLVRVVLESRLLSGTMKVWVTLVFWKVEKDGEVMTEWVEVFVVVGNSS